VENLDKGNRHRDLLRTMWQDAQDQATLAVAVANLKQVTIYFFNN